MPAASGSWVIPHYHLEAALGLSRLETEGVLTPHKVSSGVTAEEMQAKATALSEGLEKAMRRCETGS
jgi:hypothetical protein